jgi:molybdopterin-biosynthesis enzyme MoeA-like protein
MARIPAGAELIANAVSSAPGFRIANVIVMAGVPSVMHAMLAEVTPRLETGPRMLARSIHIDRPEGDVAELFAEHQRQHPEVAMGSYPYLKDGKPCAELVLRSRSLARLTEAYEALRGKLATRGILV